MNRQIINVFLASPSDLKEEREIARKVIHRINTTTGRQINISVDLYMWEDVQPTFARPQEVINKDLMKCHLFIGGLWKRWGTPSGPTHDSGFKEEFDLACELNKKGQIEDIKLFFKTIDDEFLKDPGEQLLKVIEFKKLIQSEQKVYYKEFNDVYDWNEKLFDSINMLVLGKIKPETSQATASPDISQIPSQPDEEIETESLHEGTEVIETIKKLLSILPTTHNLNDLEDDISTRLYLFSSALFYEDVLITEVLGTHEIQKLYLFRKNITLTLPEKRLIIRTLIEDGIGVKTGWSLVHILDKLSIEDYLRVLIFADPSETLRIQALKYGSHIPFDLNWDLLTAEFNNKTEEEKLAILSMFELQGKQQNTAKLDELSEHDLSSNTKKAAWRAKLKILLREDENEAFELLNITPPEKRAETNTYIDDFLQVKNKNLLRNLIFDSNKEIRIHVLEIIKKELEKETLQALSSDQEFEIRAIVLLELLKRDFIIDRSEINNKLSFYDEKAGYGQELVSTLDKMSREKYIEPVLIEYYKTRSYEELKDQLNWIDDENIYMYQALIGKYYDQFKEILLNDLKDDFIRIKQKYLEELNRNKTILLEEVGPTDTDALLIISDQYKQMDENIQKLDKYQKTKFLKSAINALSQVSGQIDIVLARSVAPKEMGIFKDQIIGDILNTFNQYGSIEDLTILMKLHKERKLSREISNKIAEIILIIDKKNEHGTWNYLFDTDDTSLIRILLKSLLHNPISSFLDRVKSLLYHRNEELRILALSYLLQKLSDSELEELLDGYPTGDTYYYYNVVCWLDRWLYAPGKLKEYYRKEIIEKLS